MTTTIVILSLTAAAFGAFRLYRHIWKLMGGEKRYGRKFSLAADLKEMWKSL